jgi:hypothetical protein
MYRFPEMKNPTPTDTLRPVKGPQSLPEVNKSPGQIALNERSDAWRKVANERLAERRRVNGHSKADH